MRKRKTTESLPGAGQVPPCEDPLGPGLSSLELVRAWDLAQYASFQPADNGPSRVPRVGERLAGSLQWPAVRGATGPRVECVVERPSETEIRLLWQGLPPADIGRQWQPLALAVGDWRFPAVPRIELEGVFQSATAPRRPTAPRLPGKDSTPVAAAASQVPKPWIWKATGPTAELTVTQHKTPFSELEGTIAWGTGPGRCGAVLEYEIIAAADGKTWRGTLPLELHGLEHLTPQQTHRLHAQLPQLTSPDDQVTLRLRPMSAGHVHAWDLAASRRRRLAEGLLPVHCDLIPGGLSAQVRYADERRVLEDPQAEWALLVTPRRPASTAAARAQAEGLT